MSKKRRMISNHLNEKQFKALIENAHEGIVLYDEKGRIIYATPAVRKITGYSQADVIGKAGTSFLHRDDVKEAQEAFFRLMPEPGKSLTLFQRIRHRKGHFVWSESRLTNFLNVPQIRGIVSNFRDITEKKLAEEAALKTQTLLEVVNRNVSEGVFMGILGKGFVYTNEAFFTLLSYRSFQQVQSVKPEEIFADSAEQKKIVKVLKSKLILENVEARIRRRNNSVFQGLLNVRLLKHDGDHDYFVGTVRDISKEKMAEQDLVEYRNFLDSIINAVPMPIFVTDDKHRLVTFNDRFGEFVGKKRKDLLGKSQNRLRLGKGFDELWKGDQAILKTGNTSSNEVNVTFRGRVHEVLLVKARYVNERKEKFVITSIAEISHIKRAEQEIKRLHENLEGVLESSEESIFSVDHHFNYTAFNNRHKQIMKLLYNADIAIGINKFKLVRDTPDGRWIVAELKKALKGTHFVTEHFQDFPKYKGYIQTTYNPIHDEHNNIKGVAVFVQDITHRKRYEQIINSINANLRAVMESTSDGIVAFDRNFRIIIFNNSYAKGIKDVYGIDVTVGMDFLRMLPPMVVERVKENSRKVFTGQQVTIESEHPHKLILETSFNPIYDDQGGVTGAALFIRDVTERQSMDEKLKHLNIELTDQNIQLASQEAELKSALDELSERNFELDQLMYKTSHDLRSPLSSIIGLINLANLDPDPSAFRQYLSKIEGRAKKLDEFIRSMLDYARVNRLELEPEEISMAAFVRACIAELEYMENFQRIKVDVFIDPPTMVYRGDRLRLKIIFSNIISNAYKYLNPEANSFLTIQIGYQKHNLSILFQDNGIGIKKEYLPKIFNMFYRATDRSQGSGLGMYIVKQAVEKMHGSISLTSEYGKGTSIMILLPKT